ncbi:MAG: glucose-1-phosphate thymidylyltransferase [Dehalococcoidia bacterium]|nr:MAG: glucose-1-phosphate thymidylyltransferase [Dehalococcoidia bacterium]
MKQAVILAAGEGQRLRPFTVSKPKAMLAIAGRPMLSYVIEALAKNGIHQIILVVGYRKEQVLDWLSLSEPSGVEITCVTQANQLGSAHALAQVEPFVNDDFLVLPGDKLIEAATIAMFINDGPQAVMAKRVDNPGRYGVLTTEKGILKAITEKPKDPPSNIINTSVYAFSKKVFEFIGPELDIPDVLNKMISEGVVISTCETEGVWLDAVYPWDILSLNSVVLQRLGTSLGGQVEALVAIKGPVSIGKGTIIRSNSYLAGPLVIGENCDIGPNVCLAAATSIGNNVAISPFSEITNSVIGHDVTIGSGCLVQDSVIDQGCNIRGHLIACSGNAEVDIGDERHRVTVGAMLGEGCTLDYGVVAEPGVILGNHSQIQAMRLLKGRLPDRSLVL